MSVELEQAILTALSNKPNQLAREIADSVGSDKSAINALLYGRLKGKVAQDKRYRWSLISQAPQSDTKVPEDQFADTELAKLARYYLACIGYDNTGVSVFAADKFGNPPYVELNALPLSPKGLVENEAARRIFGRVRNERGRYGVYLGYPTATRLIKSKKSNWQGFLVEPLLLFPVELDPTTHEPIIDLDYPIINQKALEAFTNAEPEALVSEIAQLEDELGLSNDGDPVELDELAMRLAAIRSEWPWREEIEPSQLSSSPPLAEMQTAGIYNRAILVMAERSPFTLGLETELKALGKLPSEKFKNTALGQWINGTVNDSPTKSATRSLIELLPMNLEQRQAVDSAVTQPLTIITGPPGTGKSQVVTNLLANAAWQGKRILFASKNNKAVDVVETRLNALGPRPVLLRVGARSYQAKLAEYLLGMLAATATRDDRERFQEADQHYQQLSNKVTALDMETERTLDVRNAVDALEQSVEFIREAFGQELFMTLRRSTLPKSSPDIDAAIQALDRADPTKQSIFIKLFWFAAAKGRIADAYKAFAALTELSQAAGLPMPDLEDNTVDLDVFRQHYNHLTRRLIAIGKLRQYSQALDTLQKAKPLETIAVEKAQLLDQMSKQAGRLWKLWLRLQPANFTNTDRTKLSKYNALLRMVIETGAEGELSRDVAKQYRTLSQAVAHMLPCWAVTSLSARGRIPFEPGYFDLVVFDEASQCDIASALPLLYRAKAAVVIGDPKQLSHISALPKGHDQNLLERYGLVQDFPHWAYSHNSLFSLAAGQVSGDQIVALLDHHRSHADIISFSNNHFYEDRLRVATNYDRLNFPTRSEAGVRWVDVKGEAVRPANGGAVNRREVEAVVAVLKDLLVDKGYRGSVGVVTPFRSQFQAIEQAVRSNEVLSYALPPDFLVDTVHKFQGDERDVMIFSPVLSDGMPKGGLNFLRSNPNLFNVAITRARAQLIVVGDRTACLHSEVGYLAAFAAHAAKVQMKANEDVTEAFGAWGPEYPPVTNPEQVSDWEAQFYQALYAAGIKAVPQYSVEKYRLDFLVVDGDRRLDIEIDGERYHRNWTGELCRRDQIRNHRLYELGYDVMRFWVYEVRDDMDGCIARIQNWMEKSRSQQPLSSGSIHEARA